MARNPIYDILETQPAAQQPAAGAQPRNPIYDILPTKPIEIPKDVMRFGGRSGSEANFRLLSPAVQEQLIAAAQDYHAQTGRKLQVNSAFRSADDQKRLYDESVAAGRPGVGPTGMPIAKPGTSKHQRGIVVDIQQGKDDPVAQQILSQRGFAQNVAGDPVHFEFVRPLARTEPAPTTQMASEPVREALSTPIATPLPPERTIGQRIGQQVAGAGVGAAMGATAGLGQYLPAALLYGASQIAPQGQPLSFRDALSQVRETTGGIREAAPTAYMGGEIGGGIAGFARLAGLGQAARAGATLPGIGRQVAAGAGMGATTELTRAPETGAVDALIGATIGGATAGIGGAAAKAIEKGGITAGKYSVTNVVKRLTGSKEPEAKVMLDNILGPAYRAALDIVESKKPVLPSNVPAKELVGWSKKMKAWEAEKAALSDIDTFAQRYVKNPKLLQKYGVQEAVTPFQQAAKIAPKEIKSAIGRSAVQDVLSQGAAAAGGTLGGIAGATAGMMLSPENPIAGAHLGMFGGGMAGAALGGLGRYGAASYYLSPAMQSAVRLGSVGAAGAGYGATIPLSQESSEIRQRFRGE